jgi:CDP-glycerol glycerophosphotransferase
MKKSDYFVYPSAYEGQGIALIEALACGLKTIVTPIPTSIELLQGEKYGITAKGIDSDSLAEAIIRALRDDKENLSFDLEKYNEQALKKFEEII